MAKDIDRYSPLGFYNLAEDFYRVAALARDAVTRKHVRLRYHLVLYHLHTHSIELALKAFLRANGVTMEDLKKKFGHGLLRIYQQCIKSNLTVEEPEKTAEVIDWLN